jgi:transposase
LNRSIHANCWGLIAQRLAQKMSASGTTLVVMPAQYSSQQCRSVATRRRKTVRAKRISGAKRVGMPIMPTATRHA